MATSQPKLVDGTDYGGGLYSRKGNLTYNQKPTDAWSGSDVDAAWNAINAYSGKRNSNYWAEYAKIRPLKEAADAAAAQEEYNAMMAEYQGLMSEAMAAMAEKMTAVEDAKEPLKKAAENYEAARDDVSRRQNLRSGLLSLYTRYGNNGMFTPVGGADKATNLGG